MARFYNVNQEIRAFVSLNSFSTEGCFSFNCFFTIKHFHRQNTDYLSYIILHCKGNKAVADSLLLDREVLALLMNVSELQVRTLHVAREIINGSDGRLDPAIIIIVHADRNGDEKL